MKKRRILLIAVVVYLIACTVISFGADKKVVSQAEIVSGGDLLISEQMLNNSKTKDGYNFNYIFKHVDEYVQAADYAVVNLETSIGGKALGYCGFPRFNTPASIVTAAKNAGFDMFLTSSNHSYDLGYEPVKYRISVLEDKAVDFIGTRKDTSKPFHKVITVNGIKIGMMNYTKESWTSTKDRVVLNITGKGSNRHEVVVDSKGKKLIASYNEKYLNEFYANVKKNISTLKKKGAEVIVLYPHWGSEYNIGIDDMEDTIAQKLCDLGVDVIIGGHPHVVEPVKVYTSKKSGKTTICLHSMGNFVSNMGAYQTEKENAPYTQDGALFKYIVKKYSDGTVAVTKADVLPLYVFRNNGKNIVIPLDINVKWSKFGIANYSAKKNGYKSYHRTNNLVSKGLKKYNNMPKIYKQPNSIKAKAGKAVSYRIAVSGNNLKYQWQYSSDGGKTWDNSKKTGNKTNKITLKATKPSNGVRYRCRVKNGTGTVFSRTVKLTVE